ncbi:hypothetical protein JMUB6875_66910 [Nocardia sp. JMUB6875]
MKGVATDGCKLSLGRLLSAADVVAREGDGGPTGTEHPLLSMLHDPSMIPTADFRAMQWDPADLLVGALLTEQDTDHGG